MADGDVDVETRAREMGWDPNYQGTPEKPAVSAEEFVERGERILPIVRAHNKKLEQELRTARQQIEQLAAMQHASQESMQALLENHEQDVQRAVEKERAKLTAEIKQARVEGDVELEMELRDKRDALSKPENDTKKPPQPQQPPQQQYSPDFIAWAQDHPEYGTDMKYTALAEAIGIELRKKYTPAELSGRRFYDTVAEEVDKILNPGRAASKVEGSRPSGGGGGGGGGGKGYSDLPADAKAQCDKDAKKLVGPGRAFKTDAEWRSHYAKLYFRGE